MPERFDRVMVGLLVAIVVLLVGGVVVHVATPGVKGMLGMPSAAPSQVPRTSTGRSALRVGTFTLRTRNALGRSGTLFIPKQAAESPRPLLILFHGTGGSGAHILAGFVSFADARGIVLLAPDSGRSPDGNYNWQVPDRPGDTTADTQHVLACLEELYATEGLAIETGRVLAAGHSGGASSAAYLGTTDPRVRAVAVLHGGVFAGGLGQTRPRAWFSTGTEDPLRPPAVMERAAAATRPHATEVATRLYAGGHDLSALEQSEMLAWWLDG